MKNVCVVGYGSIGPVHARAVDKTEGAALYAVCDTNEAMLVRCAEVYKNIVQYKDYDDVLADDNIHSVHICTPHYLHFEMTKRAILAGKEVVLEKPAAMLANEFEELKELCGIYDSRVCVMFQNRTANCVVEMKRLIAELGEIKGIYASLTWLRDMDYYNHDQWRGKLATEGGGVLINQAIHLLDLILYMGGEAESVVASTSTKLLDIEVEDTADALITLKSGARACFYATNTYTGTSPFRLELVFEDTTLRYEDKNLYMIKNGEVKIIASDNMSYSGKSCWGNGHEHVIDDFYSGKGYTTLFDADSTMKTLFAIYESANEKKHVEI